MIFIDFETRSFCPLPDVGGRGYARDMSSELLLCVAIDATVDPARAFVWSPFHDVDGTRIRGWEVSDADLATLGFPANAVEWCAPDVDLPWSIESAARDGVPFVAHNGDSFDRHVWDGLGYPAVVGGWVDTMSLVARRSLPRGLEKAGLATFGVGKDALGHRLMQLSSQPQRKGPNRGGYVPPDSARLSRIANYCAKDALLMAAIWYEEDLGAPHVDDPVLTAHRRVNDRGVLVDVDTARRVRLEEQQQKDLAISAAVKLSTLVGAPLRPESFNAPLQIAAWLRGRGLKSPDATRDTLEALLDQVRAGPDLAAPAVIEARLAVGKITSGKVDALLARTCPDRRLRDMYVYYGAHTGRWSGRGVQTQNLTAPKVKVPEDVYDHPENAPLIATEEEIPVADVFSSMLRGFFIAPEGRTLGIVDYASVEARKTLWCARDYAGLAEIVAYDHACEAAEAAGQKKPRGDSYERLAARIYSVPLPEVTKLQRQAGKIGVLACGYQGGPDALTRMAEKMGIDLAAAGVTADQVVEAWRDANPLIAGVAVSTWTTPGGRVVVIRRGGIWRDAKEAAEDVVRGFRTEARVARCLFRMEGKHLTCVLPSGRAITYRHALYEKVPNRYGGESWSVTYASARGMRVATYGGKLVENIVQAACRDLMASAMVALEGAGLDVVMHTHDELVFECRDGTDDYERGLTLIRRVPAWAEGMPVEVDGCASKRYRKP